MVGHDDPEGIIIRAADGFLSVRSNPVTKEPVKSMNVEDELIIDVPKDVDWNGITDKKELEEYALEHFGVDLNRRKTLDNMKKELKEYIEGQKEDNELEDLE
uniref:Inh N-terminal domain-containing protein n=1 Tax=viral metagenome TaxID=1070528 RepID=A0A6M3LFP4_9ZZZZ